MNPREDFLLKAYELGIIKFGNFTLKSGIESPFYVDLRPLASSPSLLKTLSNNLLSLVENKPFELICGVPYAALPMATTMSLESGIPLIIKRKENKGYGTKKMIEGVYQQNQNCLLVEDVITSGKSLVETIDEVEKEGLAVTDLVVVLDREQGGKERLAKNGYQVHTLFTIKESVQILHKYGRLSTTEVDRVIRFLEQPPSAPKKKKIGYESKHVKHPVAKKLLNLALKKQSNLVASLDVTTTQEVLAIAQEIGEEVVAVKLHADVLTNFDFDFIDDLSKIAREKDFLILEDRKFGDIGNTQELQFKKGKYKIAEWADMVTAHPIAGEKSLEVFDNTGVVAIVEMSSQGTLTDDYYATKALNVAKKTSNVFGVVAQRIVSDDLLLFTPGVNMAKVGDSKGQQYNSPQKVISNYHTDFIIVGRGIYKSSDPKAAAQKYRKAGWESYLETQEN